MIIKWRDELTIDRGPIDQDHHTLIAIINRFETVTPGPDAGPKLEDILDSLEQYARVWQDQRVARRPRGLETVAGLHAQAPVTISPQ